MKTILKKVSTLVLAVAVLFSAVYVMPEVKAATQVKATAANYQKYDDFTANASFGSQRYWVLVDVDATLTGFDSVFVDFYNGDTKMVMPNHGNQVEFVDSDTIRVYIWVKSIDASKTLVSEVQNAVVTLPAGTTFGSYEVAEDMNIKLSGESASLSVPLNPFPEVASIGEVEVRTYGARNRYEFVVYTETAVNQFAEAYVSMTMNGTTEVPATAKANSIAGLGDGTLRVYVWVDKIDASATTSADIQGDIVTLKAGLEVGGYVFTEDVNFKITDKAITIYTPPVNFPEVTSIGAVEVKTYGARDRYEFVVNTETAVNQFAEAYVSMTMNGTTEVPATARANSIAGLGDGTLRVYVWVDKIDASATTSADIQGDIVTLKAGLEVGGYVFTEDVNFKITDKAITIYTPPVNFPEVTSIGAVEVKTYGARDRYEFVVNTETAVNQFAEAYVSMTMNGTTEVPATAKANSIAGLGDGTLRVYVWVDKIDASATTSADIQGDIVTLKAGLEVGGYIFAEDVAFVIYGTDIQIYKAPIDITDEVPTQEGKLFAGWYADQHCTQPIEEGATQGYAKFVDAATLKAKSQITAGVDANSEKADIRFVATVDSLDYQEVGFIITIEGRGTKTVQLNKVYDRLYVVKSENVDEILPTEFSSDSAHFFTYSFWDVPAEAFDTEFLVQAYYKTLDGTVVYGEAVTRTIEQGFNIN